MKTRILIKRYTLDPEIRKTVDHLAGPNAGTGKVLANAITVALEFQRLEEHHKEETAYLISIIEKLEKALDDITARTIALNDPFSKQG